MVDKTKCGTRGESGELGTPLANPPYGVRELPERRIAAVRTHKWHVGTRLVLQARGDATNYI